MKTFEIKSQRIYGFISRVEAETEDEARQLAIEDIDTTNEEFVTNTNESDVVIVECNEVVDTPDDEDEDEIDEELDTLLEEPVDDKDE